MSLHDIQKITKLITISLVKYMITCLNMFPSKNWISINLSQAAKILGSLNPEYNNLNITFGLYGKFYVDTTNSTKQRTVGAISLSPENERVRYNFMTLVTGKHLHAFIWTELPINDQIIQRVNYLATKENRP